MAITTVPLTGKLTAPGSGGIAVRGTVAAFPNTTNYALSFSADNENTLGPVVADVAADGTFTLDIPVNSDQQASLLWTIVVKTSERVPGLNKTVTWTPGTFAISAAVDLADLEAVAVTAISETALADFAQMVTDAETARDEAVAVGNTNDTIIAGRINDPASATSGALSATYVSHDIAEAAYERGISFTDPAIGGVGDDAADNTAAWNTAMTLMAARGGGTLFFPAGIYKINGTTNPVPGGVWLVGEGFDYHTPDETYPRPVKMSVIRAGAVMTRLVQLGSDATVSTPGATGSSMFGLVVDGAGLAGAAVKTAARRNKIIQCQVGYGTAKGVDMSGQNGKIDHCVIDQAGVGDCVVINRYPDNKVKASDIRQPGTTGACVRVMSDDTGGPYNVDMPDINGCHMWAGQNGVPAAAQALIVIQGQVAGAHITNNTIELINGHEILLKAHTGSISDVLISGNKFYTLGSSTDNTYSVIFAQGAVNVQDINVIGNTIAGVDATHRFKAFIEFGTGGANPAVLNSNRWIVTGNTLRNVSNLLAGTPPHPINWGDNPIRTATATLYSRSKGKTTFSGTGAQTAFTIPHLVNGTPTSVRVTPGSAAAAGSFYVTVDGTNITVTFTTAPASGTNNVVLNWQADL